MYRFFVDDSQITQKTVVIKGSDYNHMKNVLRIKIGEEFNVSNGHDSKEIRCAVKEYTDDSAICEIRFIKEEDHELPVKVYLFQGLPKLDKMETVIIKNVELGVHKIIPVEMKRCVVKLDDKKKDNKISRWRSISESAAKQSKRSIIPEVTYPMTFKEAIDYAKENCNVLIFPYEMAEGMDKTRSILDSVKENDTVAIFIGSEGGFDDEEVNYALENGFKVITLGKRILRTETAGMCLMSVLMYRLEK